MKKIIYILALTMCLMVLGACSKSQERTSRATEANATPIATNTVTKAPTPTPVPIEYVYRFYIPSGYSIYLNNEDCTAKCKVVSTYMNPEYVNTNEYVTMPSMVEYETEVFYSIPDIKVFSKDKTLCNIIIDDNNYISLEEDKVEKVIPEDRKEQAYTMAKAWSDFVTSDLSGGYNGLDIVRQYLIRDSYYWNLAYSYAVGADITFISNHSASNNQYTDIVIDNYKEFGIDCYSASISFTKSMYLNKVSSTCVDGFDMTIYFVNYDDTDDGVDNPHWAMADMVTNVAKPDAYEEESFDENGVRIEEVSGRSFKATIMIVKDPSQVFVGTVGNNGSWPTYGKPLLDLVDSVGGVGGINGGLYSSSGNRGGYPLGLIVEKGKVTMNGTSGYSGLYMVGLDNDNKLIIKNVSGMSGTEFANYVNEAGIRDAVAFQEDQSDSKNHFVPLIVDGESREMGNMGNGANPRTVIAQRSDGAIILMAVDGRGAEGHIGASATELIEILEKYDVVNAANLDGGSSTAMVYDGQYRMPSVTFYYHSSSWNLPSAFVVKGKSE